MRFFTIVTFVLLSTGLFAQSTPYFPLQSGDYWEYDMTFGDPSYQTVLGDTIMPNDKTYTRVGPPGSPYLGTLYRQSEDTIFHYETYRNDEHPLFKLGGTVGEVSIEHAFAPGDTFRTVLEYSGTHTYFGRTLQYWSFSIDWSTMVTDDEGAYQIVDSLGVRTMENYFVGIPDVLRGAIISGIQYGILTSVEPENQQSDNFILAQNYPNPFNPTTTIQYSLTETAEVTLSVFDLSGRKVVELVSERQAIGVYELAFDASALTSGVYFYRLQADEFIETRKMLLVR